MDDGNSIGDDDDDRYGELVMSMMTENKSDVHGEMWTSMSKTLTRP